ncbi:redoxin domain-containing protein [Natronomonas sp. CBA1123]|uniref:redoxin domain-containing protein n=1 Tax=Natronomonas sp. CBA1123 TaxID=2668070 RepID=UPI0012EA72C0|nr:redoxin domain-containing protein [Natronomonas sp. CBA1123]MUV87245.1 redoxin domain-containing protein [Natronomonas sp. CBA1123]
MIREGQTGPDFALPGVERGEPNVYELFKAIEAGDAVLLWFFPSTFLPTTTAELCAIRDAGWHGHDGLQVWGVSMDSIYAAAAYADDYDLPVVLLGDGGSAAEYYGVRYEEWEGHYGPPKRAAFLLGSDWTVEFAWTTDDAFAPSDPSPVEAVAEVLGELFPNLETDVSVDYDAYFG